MAISLDQDSPNPGPGTRCSPQRACIWPMASLWPPDLVGMGFTLQAIRVTIQELPGQSCHHLAYPCWLGVEAFPIVFAQGMCKPQLFRIVAHLFETPEGFLKKPASNLIQNVLLAEFSGNVLNMPNLHGKFPLTYGNFSPLMQGIFFFASRSLIWGKEHLVPSPKVRPCQSGGST